MRIRIGDAVFDLDRTKTEQYYHAAPLYACDCCCCRNFIIAASHVPPSVRGFLQVLGVQIERISRVNVLEKSGGLFLYECICPLEGRKDFYETYEYCAPESIQAFLLEDPSLFYPRPDLVMPMCLELHFLVELPWMLPESLPD